MSNESPSYLGDIGTEIETTLNTDLTGISTVSYKIIKPSGDISTLTCTIKNVLLGIISYITISGDFNEVGVYFIQTLLVFNNGDRFLSKTESFEIFEEFK